MKTLPIPGKSVTGAISLIRSVACNLRDFVYPPLCTLCDNPLFCRDLPLCAECLDKLRLNASERDACPRCGQNRKLRECACDFAWDQPFERIFSIFDYDDTVRAIVSRVKYHGCKNLAYYAGFEFSKTIPSDFLNGAEVLAPVPLHFIRLMHRGYNQSEWLARGISEGLGGLLPVFSGILFRSRNTKSQTRFDREKRKLNLSKAFRAKQENLTRIKGKTVILVDDVITTGTTAAQCTKTLLDAGATGVRVLSLARD